MMGLNIGIGVFLIAFVMSPIAYCTNLWDAKRFPIIIARLFRVDGAITTLINIVVKGSALDMGPYEEEDPFRISTFFALTYGVGFAKKNANFSCPHVNTFY